MLTYRYDREALHLTETANGDDIEFTVSCRNDVPRLAAALKHVQNYFENNEVYTDVLFYIYEHHEYRIIVRRDYYVDFLLQLFKHRILERLEWAQRDGADMSGAS